MQNALCKQLDSKPEKIAEALGWFSIGLGLAELLAPRLIARIAGARPRPGLIRWFGLRELVSGIGLLTQPKKGPWLKARVAGDALDLASLGSALGSGQSSTGRVLLATAAVSGVTAVDVLCATRMSERPFKKGQSIAVEKSITIDRPPEELYRFWRDFEQLPRFMSHLQSVTVLDNSRSHWVTRGPAGVNVEWDAQIIDDRPNQLIAWRSLEGSDVDNSGEVHFEPATGGRGTVVRVRLQYNPPAGKLGSIVAKLLGEAPEKQIAVDMMRFKQIIEAGEVARTEGQPAARERSTSRKYDDLVRA